MGFARHWRRKSWTRTKSSDRRSKGAVKESAAELKRAIPAYQPPAPNYDWTGFYVGAHVGGSWFKSNGSTINTATGAPFAGANSNTARWGGGVQLGFDYVMPSRLVIGVEADMSSGGTTTTTFADASGTSANQTTVFDSETVRGRVGYAATMSCFTQTAAGRGQTTNSSGLS